MQIGSIVGFASSVAPEGYLPCDGSTYSQAEYPELYAMIGNKFGGPAGSFNVPDLRGQFLRGADMIIQTPGMYQDDATAMPKNEFRAFGTASSAGAHSHSGFTNSAGDHSHSYQTPSGSTVEYGDRNSQALDRGTSTRSTGTSGRHSHTVSISSAGQHSHNLNINVTGGDAETRPMNMGVLYCICAKAPAPAAVEGPKQFGYACLADGTEMYNRGFAPVGVSSAIGRYEYQFAEPLANAEYAVVATLRNGQTNNHANVVEINRTGFVVQIGKSATKPNNAPHSVIVMAN